MAATVDMHTHQLCTQLRDLQTMLQVYRSTVITKAPHLFAADIHHNSAGHRDMFAWQSSFAMALTQKMRDLLKRISGKSTVSNWVLDIAHLQL